MRGAVARAAAAVSGCALACSLAGCAGEAGAVTFLLTAPGDGTAQATATVVAIESEEPVIVTNPESGVPPPGWLGETALARVNGVPLPRVSDSGFAATFPFAVGTPVELQIADGVDLLVVTRPVEIGAVEVLGPPPGAARSASEDLTVTLDQPASEDVMVLVREASSGVAAVSRPVSAGGASADRVVPAADLASLREQALAAGAPLDAEGLAVEIATLGASARSGACDVADGIDLSSCIAIVEILLDARPVTLIP